MAADRSGLGRGLLAVGDPAYGALASSSQGAAARGVDCASPQALHFDSLPAARAEVHDISKIWASAPNASGTDRGGTTLLEGSAASKAAVIAASPGKRVLHLATHGFFLGNGCEPVAAGARGVGGLAVTSDTSTGNPLHLSGLAFAGANVPSPRDSGVLTAEEVTSLNLQGTEWAVLASMRRRGRRHQGGRGGTWSATRVSNRRSSTDHHEPLGCRRRLDAAVDACPLRRPFSTRAEHRRRRPTCRCGDAQQQTSPWPEHSSLLLGRLRRSRRLALVRRFPSGHFPPTRT